MSSIGPLFLALKLRKKLDFASSLIKIMMIVFIGEALQSNLEGISI